MTAKTRASIFRQSKGHIHELRNNFFYHVSTNRCSHERAYGFVLCWSSIFKEFPVDLTSLWS